jgi:hypothetical protein
VKADSVPDFVHEVHLRDQINSTYRFQSTKRPEMCFRAQLTEGVRELELALV